MNMRERILAVVKGRELDRVPFVQYDNIVPPAEVWELVGRENLGLLRWSAVHAFSHPNCRFTYEKFTTDTGRGLRITLHTPAGDLWEERLFEEGYGSAARSKHFVTEPSDYDAFLAYLRDCKAVPWPEKIARDRQELADDGVPLVAVPRTPYQQLWIEWTGLDMLAYHMADVPDRVEAALNELHRLMYEVFDLVCQSDVDFVDFPDNITAPILGVERFCKYCVPYYRELAGRLESRGVPVFVHMDGDLRPLHSAIGTCGIRGLDSFSPQPDNDTSVAEAVELWPDMRLFVNFPSSCHLLPPKQVREVADRILAEGGATGRLQIQISENVPKNAWRTSYPAIVEAIAAFGAPSAH